MYFFVDRDNPYGEPQRHILLKRDDGSFVSFPMVDDNPNMVEYLAWVAEGNTAEEWTGE